MDQSIDIDLGLWESQSSDNPVYYVQYGHARLCSIGRKAAELGIDSDGADLSLLTHDREGDLIRTLGEFPAVLEEAAQLRGFFQHGRELAQGADEVALAIMGEQGEVCTVRIDAQLGCLAADGAQAGVAVLHVVDGVIRRLRLPQS